MQTIEMSTGGSGVARHEYDDLVHQLRSPLTRARTRARRLADDAGLSRQVRDEILAIASECASASQAAEVMGIVSDPGAQSSVAPVTAADLADIAAQAGLDYEIACHRRGLRVEVDQASFGAAMGVRLVPVDLGLFEVALRNLLDNALKYSYPDTAVRVWAETSEGHVSVAVENRGLPIEPGDVAALTRRGVRGAKATLVTGEGSGLGLWIASRIMRAHGGSVDISPTANGLTVVRLTLPTPA